MVHLCVTGQPLGPPPSDPPPPVPAAWQHHPAPSPGLAPTGPAPTKALAAPPPLHRSPTSPLPRKPPPTVPPPILKERPRGLPSPLPFATHPPKLSSSTPPPPPPPPANAKPAKGRWPPAEGRDRTEWRSPATVQSSTLPICERLETSLSLNGPTFSPSSAGGSQSLDSYHKGAAPRLRPCQPPLHPTNAEVSPHRPVDSLSLSQIPGSHLPLRSPPLMRPGPCYKPETPRAPPATAKAQLAAGSKPPGAPPQ